jgi:hypothetical protein
MELAVRKQCAEVLNPDDGRGRNPIGGTDGLVSRAELEARLRRFSA